eukprot:5106588-Ditylum_brightwellii.AAC.1
MQNPITILNIQQHQFQDLPLNQLCQQHPDLYPVKFIDGRPLICCRDRPNDPAGLWRIALPTALARPVVAWYHFALGHGGTNRLYDTIRAQFKVPGLCCLIEEFQCAECQRNWQLGQGYGELPAQVASLMPWEEVAMDLIGPWWMQVNGQEVELNALTCIDPVTNLVEMIRLDNKTSEHVACQFDNVWLARYLQPGKCIHDNGGEFISAAFQQLLQQ